MSSDDRTKEQAFRRLIYGTDTPAEEREEQQELERKIKRSSSANPSKTEAIC